MEVLAWFKGGVVGTAGIALRLGELYLEATQNTEELALQRPLTVEDQGDTWLVRGSRNRDLSQEGTGPFHMTVKKRDGQVLDIGIPNIIKFSPEEEEAFKATLRSTGYLPPEK
ncbi:MAG TPA: NTF2 fold immunity protein [Stellaceae bacterium]|nr:NTF2 fold immunity protein [Stellaceae bacterium]